jgi:NAD+ kinase
MKILVIENPARPLGAKDKRDFTKLLRGHKVTFQALPKHRRPPLVKLDVQLLIAIGGDGSVLGAAHLARGQGIPILGFNTGHVGFLAGITLENFRKELPHILAGRSMVEDRISLKVELPNGKSGWGLNDIGFQSADRDLFSAELTLNGRKVSDFKGDGLVVATATGSTAYNLSLGGPLLAPDSEMIAVTPKAPLTLTNRALVVYGPKVLGFRITGGRTRVENDSIPTGIVNRGDLVFVHRSPVTVPIVFPADHNHYAAVGEKLRWNENLIDR